MELNCSPRLKMDEITKHLFNYKFLSDVQFSIDDHIIYAHSLMLMMRSEIFEIQFKKTLGVQKLIPILDCSYANFLEFIRFIYTDECEINDRNGIELLKLAIKYKLIILENLVINILSGLDWGIQLFEYCATEKYEIARSRGDYFLTCDTGSVLKHKQFLTLHPDAVNTVLQLEMVNGVTEFQIFSALAKWINNYCELNQMSLAEGRQKFEHFIRQIRFPTMTNTEIRDCAKNNPGLLNEGDCMSIAKQVLFGDDTGWLSKPRDAYVCKYEWRNINRATSFETKFAVRKDMILRGLWIGVERNKKKIEIEITGKNMQINHFKKNQFTQSVPGDWNRILINLGDTILIKRNFDYTITIRYLEVTDINIEVLCRVQKVNLIYNNPENAIERITASSNMFEMIFVPAPM